MQKWIKSARLPFNRLIITAALALFAAAGVFGQTGLEIIVEDNDDGLTIIKSAGSAKTLIIPGTIDGKPITVIGSGAFTHKGLVELSIPDSVTEIGDSAFSYNMLQTVSIGNNVVSIGQGAFTANKLTSVTLGEKVSHIGKGAFSENELTGINFPASLTVIDDYAFFSNKIKELTFPGSLEAIGEGAFSGNRLTAVIVGDGVTRIGDGAFYNNRIISVRLPESLEALGKRAFDTRPPGGRIRGSINYTDQGGNVLYTTANNFDTYYASNGRKPGQYKCALGAWALSE